MKLGLIGLGKMGRAIAHRVLQGEGVVFGFDADSEALTEAKKLGIKPVKALEELPATVDVIWLMIPAGAVIDEVLETLKPKLHGKNIVVDGGNSKFTNSARRAQDLEAQGVYFLDCGTSGGLRGQDTGFSLMVGGNKRAFSLVEPLLKVIAAPNGYGYMGPAGAGHYVKMVHNGIEYALMQAYAEGFHLLRNGYFEELNLAEIASVWQHGAVIRSWLLELVYEIVLKDQALDNISGSVSESGMGRWTIEDARKNGIPVQLIEDALAIRLWSQETGGNYATKLVTLLRNKFGGHAVKKSER